MTNVPLSEFRYNNGRWLNGDCMETALATAMSIAKGFTLTPDFINSVVNGMGSNAQPNGATTLAACYDYARSQGYQPLDYVAYHEPFTADFHNILLTYAVDEFNSPPIVVNVANGQALPGDEKGLHYHGITLVGRDTDGYLAADGDRLQAQEAYQHYTIDELFAAQPCGLLVLALQRPSGLRYYTVKRGDTLGGIALSLGVTLAHLEQSNAWLTNPNLIYPNQQIPY